MSYTFNGCSSLISLDITNFDRGKVTSMSNMLSECSALISLEISYFDTRNAQIMNLMFYKCSFLHHWMSPIGTYKILHHLVIFLIIAFP